jgi:hypothetical protein
MVVVRDMAGSSYAACIQYNQKKIHIKNGGDSDPPLDRGQVSAARDIHSLGFLPP